ncbi:MAG: hypothetical protein V2J02_02010 [Pseudomonadales bacterium]|jgi:hypothetical protein|nr:hypothetical protein [Pseudomonadales bacterium]
MGWLTVVAYGGAAAAGARVARFARGGRIGPRPDLQFLFWTGVAILYGLLAVNKQLDLQSAFTAVGRCLALRDGWYEDRRLVQIGFIVGLACVAAAGVALAAYGFRAILAGNRLAFLGLLLTTTFVLVRAVGFHHVDSLISARVLGLRMNWVLELSGIALVTAAAFGRCRERVDPDQSAT